MTKTYTDSWLKTEEGLGGVRPVLTGSAEDMRSQYGGLIEALSSLYPTPSDAVRTQDGSNGSWRYRVYTPIDSTAGRAPPIGVYYHPGGFVIGGSQADDAFCYTIAEATESIIVSVQYRLSPENKAPAHLDDAVAAFAWAHQSAAKLGGDQTRMFTIGASAGAGLAFSVARKVALGQSSASPNSVKGVVALCPCTVHPDHIPTAYQAEHRSYVENGTNVPLIDKASMLQFFADSGLKPDDKDYFVILDEEHHSLLPPAYIATCEFDPLRDDGKIMAEGLKKAGVSVKTDHYSGLPHCFWNVPSLPETGGFMENAAAGVKWVISKM